jgi:hypothetical protein
MAGIEVHRCESSSGLWSPRSHDKIDNRGVTAGSHEPAGGVIPGRRASLPFFQGPEARSGFMLNKKKTARNYPYKILPFQSYVTDPYP